MVEHQYGHPEVTDASPASVIINIFTLKIYLIHIQFHFNLWSQTIIWNAQRFSSWTVFPFLLNEQMLKSKTCFIISTYSTMRAQPFWKQNCSFQNLYLSFAIVEITHGVTANRDDTDFHHAKPQILYQNCFSYIDNRLRISMKISTSLSYLFCSMKYEATRRWKSSQNTSLSPTEGSRKTQKWLKHDASST